MQHAIKTLIPDGMQAGSKNGQAIIIMMLSEQILCMIATANPGLQADTHAQTRHISEVCAPRDSRPTLTSFLSTASRSSSKSSMVLLFLVGDTPSSAIPAFCYIAQSRICKHNSAPLAHELNDC